MRAKTLIEILKAADPDAEVTLRKGNEATGEEAAIRSAVFHSLSHVSLTDQAPSAQKISTAQQLCRFCENAVPGEDGTRGCEWSEGLRPVPGWDAEMVVKAGCGYTWRIRDCPKYRPEELRRERTL